MTEEYMDNEQKRWRTNTLEVGAMDQSQVEQPQTEGQESEEGSQQEQSAAKKEAEEVKKLNKLKLKVFGEEIEEDLPFEIEENPEVVEYLTKQLQLSKAAQRAMQENSTYKQQVNQFLSSIKSNTKEVLAQMGIDPREFAAQVIEEELKRQQMTPEQLELEELRQEKKRLEEERKKEREDFERKELERAEALEFERVENGISQALEASDLPKSPRTVQRIAYYMHEGLKKGC